MIISNITSKFLYSHKQMDKAITEPLSAERSKLLSFCTEYTGEKVNYRVPAIVFSLG